MALRPLDPPATPPACSGPSCIVPLCRELTYEDPDESTRLSRRRNGRDTHDDFVQLNDTLIFCWPALVCGMVSEEGYTTYADTFTHLARVVRLAGSALDGRLGLVSLSDCDDRESVLPDSFVAWFDHSAAPVPPEAALYLVRRLAGTHEPTFEHLGPDEWRYRALQIASPFEARLRAGSVRLIVSDPSGGPLSPFVVHQVRDMFLHYELGFDESVRHAVPFIDEALPFARLSVSLDAVGPTVRAVARDQLTGCLLRHACWMVPHPVYIPPLPIERPESSDEDDERAVEERSSASSASSEGDAVPRAAVEELAERPERL